MDYTICTPILHMYYACTGTGVPAPNKTSEASHYFIGRDPQYLPYGERRSLSLSLSL
eukprot:COSAG03_NODE_5912_length_1149_cov_0.834286_1_plen_56_part_01